MSLFFYVKIIYSPLWEFMGKAFSYNETIYMR